MLRTLAALMIGEALLLAGLWLAWSPAALLAAGAQLTGWALLHDEEPKQ